MRDFDPVSATRRRRMRLGVLVTTMVPLLVAGCGSSSKSKSGGGGSGGSGAPAAGNITAQKDDAIAAQVPSNIKSKGTLIVAVDATYPPDEYFDTDGKTVIGLDVDLAHALGQVVGMKFDVHNATFDTIIPGLASGKFDLGMSSFTDSKVREKTVDFVTYYRAGTSFMIKAGNTVHVNTRDDLCGLKVAVQKGTTQLDDVNEQSAKCTAAGRKAVIAQAFPDLNSARLALLSGRVDIELSDSPSAIYQVKHAPKKFAIIGQAYDTVPFGVAIPKNNGMAKPLLAAMKKLMADGIYTNILKKWDSTRGAITDPVINGAIN